MQNDIRIETPESSLNIIYGSINTRKERELARASVKYILTDLNDIRCNYIRLGFHLNECASMKYYEDFGYDSMEEFCEKNFGLDKTAVSRCINICKVFCKGDQFVGALKESGCKMYLDDRWSEYSYSQLVEMLSMSDDQRRQIKPEMTIKEIRELKKSLKESHLNDAIDKLKNIVATSQLDVKYSDTYCKGLHGVVKQQYYKKCKGRAMVLDIVDSDGKPVEGMYSIIAIALENNGGHVVIRLIDHNDEEDPGD